MGEVSTFMPGPLQGLRIIEMAGLGPAPFAAMMLADHGAEVIRIERPAPGGGLSPADGTDVLLRTRIRLAVDLKQEEGTEVLRDLCRSADALLEGFRPGVMERLGLGPEVLLGDNPRLVYGRMTGWGQSGPLAAAAGHDINYIALSGALNAFGRAGDKPTPPINMVGDFGGGAMMLAFGTLAALLHVRGCGAGQVIDCAMTDGSALLMAMIWGYRARGYWSDARGTNRLDTGAPYYDSYETADGKWIALGAIEPQFWDVLRRKIGLAEPIYDAQNDRQAWPALKDKLSALFRTRTRAEWCMLLEGSDACFAPVLDYDEAPVHPHNVARRAFVSVAGQIQPAPAPRYSDLSTVAPRLPEATAESLFSSIGYSTARVAALRAAGVLA